jgi:hypothetical protein
MSNLFLVIWLSECIKSFFINPFFIAIIVLYSIALIIFFTFFIASKCEDIDKDDIEKLNNFRKYIKIKTYIFSVLFLIFISSFMPSKATIITFASLYQIDKYNEKNTTSKLNPEEMIKTIDMTIKKVDEYLKPKEIEKKE